MPGVAHSVFNPEGVAGCSHGWSAAQPVEAVIEPRPAPAGAARIERFHGLRPPKRRLHRWLHPAAPLGPKASPNPTLVYNSENLCSSVL